MREHALGGQFVHLTVPAAAAMAARAGMSGSAVLVVDDEAGMRDTLVAILEHHGYQVSSAPDGESAFSAVQQTDFDVVVMDIRMPGRDGVSVLEDMGVPPPQVILMTAYAQEERCRPRQTPTPSPCCTSRSRPAECWGWSPMPPG